MLVSKLRARRGGERGRERTRHAVLKVHWHIRLRSAGHHMLRRLTHRLSWVRRELRAGREHGVLHTPWDAVWWRHPRLEKITVPSGIESASVRKKTYLETTIGRVVGGHSRHHSGLSRVRRR